MIKLPRYKSGQVLEPRAFNMLYEAVEKLSTMYAAPPLALKDGKTGLILTLEAAGEQYIWLRLESGGTGGKYAWTRVNPIAPYDWQDTTETGTTTTDPAFEVNLNDSIPLPAYVPAFRVPETNELRFRGDRCV